MSSVRRRGEKVRQYIISHVEKHPRDIAARTATHFEITRQAVNKHLQRLVDERVLLEEGETRSRQYRLARLNRIQRNYSVAGLEEDVVWRNEIRPLLEELPANARALWYHGFTEMLNNVIDHSEGAHVRVVLTKTAATTEMMITDDGVGIFRKIQKAANLLDERHAVLELAKGKLTTDPKRHSGEGIFFTSRMFDQFVILSGGVTFSHDFADDEDWISERSPDEGTTVFMKLPNHTSRATKKVFDQYSSTDDYRFKKTVVPVRLAQYGDDQLISRSQAKRLLSRIELFDEVLLDFRDVAMIGQAFADEIFRVFANQHLNIKISSIHMSSAVKRMIARTTSGKQTGE